MPEHLRALVVVLVLSAVVFFYAKPALTQIIPEKTFLQWRTLWFITTLAWFLTHNFWIYAFVMCAVLLRARKNESHIFGLFLLLILAAPPAEMAIPGFGIVDHLFVLNNYRLLILVLLLPAALSLSKKAGIARIGSSPVDWAVLGYLVWISLLGFRETSFTNGIRVIFLNSVDYFLPYYVASRSMRTMADFRAVFAAFLMGALIVSAIAFVEVLRGWRLYSAAAYELGFFNYPQSYKMRGPFLRPATTVIDSIMVGWVIVVSMGGLLLLSAQTSGRRLSRDAWLLVVVGVIASMSRAPWLAALLLLLVFIIQSDNAIKGLFKMTLALTLAFVMAGLSPLGETIIALLPFIGEAEQGSVEYRANWFSVVGPIIERNFLFGDVKVLDAPELQVMRQGEGIIDLVNSFLSVLLFYGAIGLFLFLSLFTSSFAYVRKQKRLCDKEQRKLGAVLIALIVVNIFMLMTVSLFLIAPILVFSIVGFCSAFGLMCQKAKSNALAAQYA